jgi:tetratricopeptide (TPR) repeat protein/polyferredoxin
MERMGANKKKKPNYAKWRTISLISVWGLFALHFIHWKLNGTTLAPLELNEVLYTIHQGIVTAGFLLMFAIMIGTLIFGRFFCSWACHILALEDGCSWLLKKLKIRSRPIRSRALLWVPLGAVFYLFVWPQISMMVQGVEAQELRVVQASQGGWSSFVTDDFWRNLPPIEVALTTFFICGMLLVYMLGTRSFCFYGCPYGAVFGLADQVAPGRIVLTGDCIQCGTCTANCASDILVHKEIKEYGMVTNSHCFKDLDCVANCPEDAISFGFTKPPLFKKKFHLPQYKNRYSFTLAEDIAIAVSFIVCILIFRGLYDTIPFLLSVGISIGSSFLVVLSIRMVKKMSVSINNLRLKISNKVTTAGYVFILFALLFYAFTIHSAVVHYHSFVGQLAYNELLVTNENGIAVDSDSRQEKIDKALYHFEQAYALGLMKPVSLRKQMASLYLVKKETGKAEKQLKAILSADPNDIESRYRLGIIELNRNNEATAIKHFETAAAVSDKELKNDRDYYARSAVRTELAKLEEKNNRIPEAIVLYKKAIKDNKQNNEALIALGIVYLKTGEVGQATKYLERSAKLEPEAALVHNNLGAIYARQKKYTKAIVHFKKLVKLQPENAQGYYNLGMMQYGAGELNNAVGNLQQALQLQPNYQNARIGLEMISKRLRQTN